MTSYDTAAARRLRVSSAQMSNCGDTDVAGSVSLSSRLGNGPAPSPDGSGPTVGEGCAVRRLKQRDAAAFKKRGQGKPGGKTAQMGKDCDAPWACIAAGRVIICSTNHRPSTTKAGTLILPMKMKNQ